MYFFTADEHYGHRKIIKYNKRPFSSVEGMDEVIIKNHNNIVSRSDVTIHGGDFTLWKDIPGIYKKYIDRLNGKHVFLKGSHDYWMKKAQVHYNQIWERNIDGNYFVVCHYAMARWARSHYNSFHLYGHSHGNYEHTGKTHDIGVDNNNFFPVSATKILEIMETKPDNENLIKKEIEK